MQRRANRNIAKSSSAGVKTEYTAASQSRSVQLKSGGDSNGSHSDGSSSSNSTSDVGTSVKPEPSVDVKTEGGIFHAAESSVKEETHTEPLTNSAADDKSIADNATVDDATASDATTGNASAGDATAGGAAGGSTGASDGRQERGTTPMRQ
ncbi:hypothetical protein SARC_17760, partial [Sphaeroforma arctica JP610]